MSKTPEPLDLEAIEAKLTPGVIYKWPTDLDKFADEMIVGLPHLTAEIRLLRALLSTMEARAPLPPPLVWRMRPTASGWYWYKEPDPKEPAVPACVNVKENWFTIFGIHGQCSLSENALSNAWAGPIPSPSPEAQR